jgi:outer membrane lipoprotein-sorting protein
MGRTPEETMRLCRIGILIGGLLFLSERGFAEEKWLFRFESATFDLNITMEVGGRKMQAHGQGWYKENKVRWDMVMARQHISSLYDGQRAYTILLDRGIALEIPPSQMRITKGLPEYLKYEGRQVGTEEIEGKMTDIYEYERPAQPSGRPPGSADRVKDWIWRGKEFPLKTVVTSEQGRNTTVVHNIVINAAVSDSLFQLPKAIRNSVRRLGEDGQGKRTPSSGMESPQIGRSEGASLEALPRGVPIYPGAEKRMRRQMAGGRIIVVAYTSEDSLKQIVRFYETRMKEMGWMVRGGYEENEYAISCRKGIASCRIAVSEQRKKRRIGIEIQ